MSSELLLMKTIPAIRLEELSYGALEKVTFSVAQGERVALIGSSGCGKTTTLRLIAGLERPASGAIYFNNTLVSSPDTLLAPHLRKLALVFQDLALWPHMTVFQHLEFVLPKPREKAQKNARIKQLLEMVHLPYPKKYPGQLSGGEQQRLALARALAQSPDILLLDEPFSSLDAQLRNTLLAELRILLDRLKMTTIYVTHNMEEAAGIADKVAVLEHGSLREYTSAASFFSAQNTSNNASPLTISFQNSKVSL